MTELNKPTTRRRFTRRKLLAGVGALTVGGAVAGTVYRVGRRAFRLALIGAGHRGQKLARIAYHMGWAHNPYPEIVAVCDVNRVRAQKVRQEFCSNAEVYGDYRDVLDRRDVDGVLIATCDHWHAAISIAAMRAGKAVYCEKALSLTVREGMEVVKAAEETGAIFQLGTQQRSQREFRTACELVRNGRVGKIHRVTVALDEYPGPRGPFPGEAVPEGLDWDFWLGPARFAEYSVPRYGRWGRFYDYGGGQLTNWGFHHIDIAQWGLGTEGSGPVLVEGQAELPTIRDGYDVPYQFKVDMEYEDGTQLHVKTVKDEPNGILFEGDKGRLFVNRGRISGKPFEELNRAPLGTDAVRLHNSAAVKRLTTVRHIHHFLQCMQTGATPVSDVHSAHRTATVCHLGNISIRLGRKVRWDPKNETIIGDVEAEALLSRERRPGFPLVAASS